MTIAIGADHGGYRLKEAIIKFLRQKGYSVKDFGAFSEENCDYPIIGYELSKAVAKKKYSKGILMCKTGIGMSMVANKVKTIRAALCDRVDIARSSRMHNDSNVLVLAANIVSPAKARKIVDVWLSTGAEGGRHKRRVTQINKIDMRERNAK